MEVDSIQFLLPSESWSVRKSWEVHHEENVNLKVGHQLRPNVIAQCVHHQPRTTINPIAFGQPQSGTQIVEDISISSVI